MKKGNYIRSQTARSLGVDVLGGIKKMTALETYVSDKERNEMSMKSRLKAEKMFSDKIIIEKYLNCIQNY